MNESKEQLETLLSDYVDGNLAGEQLAQVEAYLEKNPGVRDVVNRIIVDSESLRSLPRVSAPFDFSEDVRGQLERDLLLDGAEIQFPQRRRISSLLATVAAMLILFIGLGGGAYWMLANRPAPYFDLAINTPAPAVEQPATPSAAPPVAAPKRDVAGPDAFTDTSPKGVGTPSAITDRGDQPVASRKAADRAVTEAAKDESAAPGAAVQLGSAGNKTSEIPEESETRSKQSTDGSISMDRTPLRQAVVTLDAAPPEVAELVEESPRFSNNAIAMVLDDDDVSAINGAVNSFALSNSVRTQSLTYDSLRNRALLPQGKGVEPESHGAQSAQMQVSGSSVAGAQLGESSAFFSKLKSQPQVLMAIGLTASQVSNLKESLNDQLGTDRLQTFALHHQVKTTLDALPRTSIEEPVPDINSDKLGAASQPSLIAIGDRLRIDLIDPGAKKLARSETVVVDDAGMIQLTHLPPTPAAGLSLSSLRQMLVEAYINHSDVQDPVVQIEWAVIPTTQPGEGGGSAGAEPAISGEPKATVEKATADDAERFDVYLVVRGESPATQPASPSPTTTPAVP